MSKADHDTSVRDLRARGETPEKIIGRAAVCAGLLDELRPLTADELAMLPTLAVLGARAAEALRRERDQPVEPV